ncbi:hypothetical protein [Thermococcus sp.]
MNLENVRPMNFSGIPFVLVVVSFVLLIVLPRVLSRVQGIFFVIGVLCLMASWGTGVEIKGDSIVLKYVFGILKIRIPFSEIEEIAALSKLQKGIIARYFKWEIVLLAMVVVYAFFDLMSLPYGLLKGYYLGDIGLILFGLFYVFAFTVPFFKKRIIQVFAYSLVPFAGLVLYLKTGSITADDVTMLGIMAFVLTMIIWDVYNAEYIVIRTPRRLYLLTTRSADELVKSLLKVAQNVQTA